MQNLQPEGNPTHVGALVRYSPAFAGPPVWQKMLGLPVKGGTKMPVLAYSDAVMARPLDRFGVGVFVRLPRQAAARRNADLPAIRVHIPAHIQAHCAIQKPPIPRFAAVQPG